MLAPELICAVAVTTIFEATIAQVAVAVVVQTVAVFWNSEGRVMITFPSVLGTLFFVVTVMIYLVEAPVYFKVGVIVAEGIVAAVRSIFGGVPVP